MEDWCDEIFAKGVGGGIEPIYLAFRSEITPALQARASIHSTVYNMTGDLPSFLQEWFSNVL